MQSIREVFSRLHLCRHTFASLWGACLRFASLWPANSRGDSCVLGVHLSNVCRGLLFCLRIAWDHALSLLSLYFSLSSQRNKEAKKIVPDVRLVSVKRSSFKRVLNLRKAYIFKSLLKVYYRSVFNESSKAFIFQKFAEILHPEVNFTLDQAFIFFSGKCVRLLVHASNRVV